MTLPVPDLDTFDFEQLFEEARALIPRYAPKWTDHNLQDPGMTLLDLIAWIVDQEIWQVGFVGDRHLKAFAALLGVRPRRSQPARGLIWPADDAIPSDAVGRDVREGAVVRSLEQPDLPFATAQGVHVTAARFRASAEEPLPEALTDSTRARRQGEVIRDDEWLEICFDRPLVASTVEAPVLPVSFGIEVAEQVSLDGVPREAWGRLSAQYRIGNGDGPWQRVDVVLDETRVLHRTGVVMLAIPPAPADLGNDDVLVRVRLRTRRRLHPVPPRLRELQLNVLPVIQLESVPASSIGVSLGLPDTELDVELEGVTDGLLPEIVVAEGSESRAWNRVRDLVDAEPEDESYVLDEEAGRVRFGNGVNGRIPPAGARVRHQGFRVTQGDAGNATAGLRWQVTGIESTSKDGVYGVNRQPMSGGADAWTIEQLREAARERAIRRDVLLTNEEWLARARRTPGVARVDVRTGFDPSVPWLDMPGSRALFAIADQGGDTKPRDSVARDLLATLETVLAARRPLGERWFVLTPERVEVRVEAEILIADGASVEGVLAEVTRQINARLSDVPVAVEPSVDPWPIGREVHVREMTARIAAVPGVVAVTACAVARAGSDSSGEIVRLAPHEVAVGGDHRWTPTVVEGRGRTE